MSKLFCVSIVCYLLTYSSMMPCVAQTLTGASGFQRVFDYAQVGSSVDINDSNVQAFTGINQEHKVDIDTALVNVSGGQADSDGTSKVKVDSAAKTLRIDSAWVARILPVFSSCEARASSRALVTTNAVTTQRTWTTARFKFDESATIGPMQASYVGPIDCIVHIGEYNIRVRYNASGWPGQVNKQWRVDRFVQTATGDTVTVISYYQNSGVFGFDQTFGSYHNTGAFELKAFMNSQGDQDSKAYEAAGLAITGSSNRHITLANFILVTIKNQ